MTGKRTANRYIPWGCKLTYMYDPKSIPAHLWCTGLNMHLVSNGPTCLGFPSSSPTSLTPSTTCWIIDSLSSVVTFCQCLCLTHSFTWCLSSSQSCTFLVFQFRSCGAMRPPMTSSFSFAACVLLFDSCFFFFNWSFMSAFDENSLHTECPFVDFWTSTSCNDFSRAISNASSFDFKPWFSPFSSINRTFFDEISLFTAWPTDDLVKLTKLEQMLLQPPSVIFQHPKRFETTLLCVGATTVQSVMTEPLRSRHSKLCKKLNRLLSCDETGSVRAEKIRAAMRALFFYLSFLLASKL